MLTVGCGSQTSTHDDLLDISSDISPSLNFHFSFTLFMCTSIYLNFFCSPGSHGSLQTPLSLPIKLHFPLIFNLFMYATFRYSRSPTIYLRPYMYLLEFFASQC
jgi:hypothetical protein